MPTTYRLERVQDFPLPREQVFEFFSDAGNLQAITPPFLHFRIVTPLPISLRTGVPIDYRLRLFGVPFAWRTQIERFEPPVRFVDRQLRGPYRLWRHLHEFVELDTGTRMIDTVDYQMPWGPLGSAAHSLFVRRTLDQIFDFRREQIGPLLAAGKSWAGVPVPPCEARA